MRKTNNVLTYPGRKEIVSRKGEHLDEVAVIVVNWNGKALLSECFESLRTQVYTRFFHDPGRQWLNGWLG